jgi:tetraspanin-5
LCLCEPPQPAERHIFERGCLRTGEEWLEANLVVVCGVAVSLAITQVTKLAVCFCSVQFDGAAIFERGCLHAAEDWLERNLIMVAVVATATCFSQVSPSSLPLILSQISK